MCSTTNSNSTNSTTCTKNKHSTVDEIEKLIINPGLSHKRNISSSFYDIYTNNLLNIFIVKVPKIDPTQIKFITAFISDKKKNQFTNNESDIIDLFIPEIITNSNYSYSGNNMFYFQNNNKDNTYNPQIYLVNESLDTILLNTTERSSDIANKYNSYVESFNIKYSNCCHNFIDIMPYIKNEIIKLVYSKLQILNTLNNEPAKEYNNKMEINNFINRLKLNITQIQVYPTNIRVSFHILIENFDWIKELYGQDIPDLKIDELATFYIKVLPTEQMIGRVYDNRVGYFTINKRIIDPNSFENNVKLITRLRLQDRDNSYNIYVDPSIPSKYYSNIRDMIAQFNQQFFTISGYRPFKLITIDEIEFPEDYDIHDLRFSTITATQNTNTGYWALANTLIDGRSGEILWFKMIINTEITTQQGRMALDYRGMTTSFKELTTFNTHKLAKSFSKQHKFLNKLKQNNIMPCCLPQDAIVILPSSEEYKLLLQSVLTHEMGHCLGLRHNFAGSVNGNTSQESASIMDYPSITQGWIGLNTANATPQITLGIYDQYALVYGYTNFSGEITGIKNSILNGLGAGYTLEQSKILTEADFLANPLNPIFLTDDVIDIDPRGNQFDTGDPFQWVEVEKQQFDTVRAKLLSDVSNGIISMELYTRLLITAFGRIIKGGIEIMAKYFAGYLYDINKLFYRTTSRLECATAMQYILKHVGDYSPDDNIDVDPAFVDNIVNYFFSPTNEEMQYLRASPDSDYDIRPLRIELLHSNLSYILFDKLLGITNTDKINRFNDADKIGEANNEIYGTSDLFTLASYMSSEDFLLTLAFSPGCNLGNNALNVPKGTPWLLLTYIIFYQTNFASFGIIPFSGIFNDNILIDPPYPVVVGPGQLTLKLPLPIPYTSMGLFPEIPLYSNVVTTLGGVTRLSDEQIISSIQNMSYLRRTKRIQFLSVLLNFVSIIKSPDDIKEYSSFISNIKTIADNIVSTYNITNTAINFSFYAFASNLNINVNILRHMIDVNNLCITILNTISTNTQGVFNSINTHQIFNKNTQKTLKSALNVIRKHNSLKFSEKNKKK